MKVLKHPKLIAKEEYEKHKLECTSDCSLPLDEGEILRVHDLCPIGKDLWSIWRYGRPWRQLF